MFCCWKSGIVNGLFSYPACCHFGIEYLGIVFTKMISVILTGKPAPDSIRNQSYSVLLLGARYNKWALFTPIIPTFQFGIEYLGIVFTKMISVILNGKPAPDPIRNQSYSVLLLGARYNKWALFTPIIPAFQFGIEYLGIVFTKIISVILNGKPASDLR